MCRGALLAGVIAAASAVPAAAVAQVLQGRPIEALHICMGCHNPDAGTVPESERQRIPRLGGQQPEYLRQALQAYRTRQRPHFYMRGMAASLQGDDLERAIAYFSAPVPGGAVPGAVPQAAATCVACHGHASKPPIDPLTPRLAGQNATYLALAYRAYAAGARQHPVMGAQAQTLDASALDSVAAWFAAQPGLVDR